MLPARVEVCSPESDDLDRVFAGFVLGMRSKHGVRMARSVTLFSHWVFNEDRGFPMSGAWIISVL